jgi:hypothetical protein
VLGAVVLFVVVDVVVEDPTAYALTPPPATMTMAAASQSGQPNLPMTRRRPRALVTRFLGATGRP